MEFVFFAFAIGACGIFSGKIELLLFLPAGAGKSYGVGRIFLVVFV